MALNPLVFLLGGLALLVSTLTIAVLNRRTVETENPYDEPTRTLDLAWAMGAIRHADQLYRAGLEQGRDFPEPTPERVAESLRHLGLAHEVRVRKSAKRVDFHVLESPSAGTPQVGEPLCHFTLGLLRGAFGKTPGFVSVTEEACHGTGSPECIFSMEVKQLAQARQS